MNICPHTFFEKKVGKETLHKGLYKVSYFGCPAFRAGGDDGIRTHDPLLAGQVLSQLSYTPILNGS